MPRFILLLVLFLSVSTAINARLKVQMWYCTFYNPQVGPYIEVYLTFEGNALHYRKSGENYLSEIEVNYTFEDSGKVVTEQKFIVQSPEIPDTTTVINFVNQHRMVLQNGNLTMKMSMKDLNSADEPVVATQDIVINYSDDTFSLSDIEIYQKASPGSKGSMFYKNGYNIVPYTYEIIPPEMNQLGFYIELYNADKELGEGEPFLITYYLEDYETGQMLTRFRGHSRKEASAVNIFMGRLLVGTLPGGNYFLKIDVLSRENELLTSRKIAFHKQNPDYKPESYEYASNWVDRYTDADSLEKHINYLAPISGTIEMEFAKNQIINKDLEMMKKYFLNFWEKRDPENPELAWYKYLKQVFIVNDNFDTPMRAGYLSDRGWRYLKYGPPNNRYESFDEPLAYPYEVWFYDKVNNQSNRIIVFFNKTEVLNEYQILHSDINGEPYNKDWNLELHRMNPSYYDVENPGYLDYFGNKSAPLLNRSRRGNK